MGKGYPLLNQMEVDMVKNMEALHLTGNVLPLQWFRHLQYPNGKPNVNAALILSDIVYWYRPIVIRDEHTGNVLDMRKKFAADKLQRSYSAYGELYGLSKRQARDAMHFLERLKLITLDFRKVEANGTVYSNVLFIDLNIDKLREISQVSLNFENKRVSHDNAYPITIESHTLIQ